MMTNDEFCEKVQSKYDCLCCFNIRHVGGLGVRIVFSMLAHGDEVEELYWRLFQLGAQINLLRDNDILISDMESLKEAAEAL